MMLSEAIGCAGKTVGGTDETGFLSDGGGGGPGGAAGFRRQRGSLWHGRALPARRGASGMGEPPREAVLPARVQWQSWPTEAGLSRAAWCPNPANA